MEFRVGSVVFPPLEVRVEVRVGSGVWRLGWRLGWVLGCPAPRSPVMQNVGVARGVQTLPRSRRYDEAPAVVCYKVLTTPFRIIIIIIKITIIIK